MKATSKLISVVLILAMCLSLFTVSAFADSTVVIPGGAIEPSQNGGIPAANNNWVGSNRGQQAAVIEGDSYQGSFDAEPAMEAAADQAVSAATASDIVPAVVSVSTAAELASYSRRRSAVGR